MCDSVSDSICDRMCDSTVGSDPLTIVAAALSVPLFFWGSNSVLQSAASDK